MVMLAFSAVANAGGYLTNTNQSVLFLRNPARDAAIGIDGVYSNPAGVIFLDNGFHLSLNIQNAHQTRSVTSTFAPFAFGMNNNKQATKLFKGVADAPVIPSILAAYNTNDWSFQFGFAVVGGGGKCEFEHGLGSFECNVALLPMLLGEKLGVNGYDADSYMRGRQYYFGFTLGAAHKLNDNLSVYGGLRMLYGNSNYYGYLRDIKLSTANAGVVKATEYFSDLSVQAFEAVGQCTEAAKQYAAAGLAEKAAEYMAMAEAYGAQAYQMAALGKATENITLNCDQVGWGVAPIIGVDYKAGKLNLAAKYEFKTRMRLKNKAANSESADNIAQLARFKDGGSVPEDSPALLTLGAQYEITPALRVMAGYHHYFDVDTKQYTKNLIGDSNEYLLGAEYDVNKTLQVSAGVQKTNYSQTDAFMNDISFNVNSWSFGFGVGINLKKNMKLNLAYFQTNYTDYNKQNPNYGNLGNLVTTVAGAETANALINAGALKGADTFTRTNRVLGVGLDITF